MFFVTGGSADQTVEETSNSFVIVIYTTCKSLANWCTLFLCTSNTGLEGGQICPCWNLCRVHVSLELQVLNKLYIYQLLMDSNDLYLSGQAMTHKRKHLEFEF